MSQARDIIAGHLDEPTRDAEFFAGNALAALRSAANASPTDTITIGPDGTVGRLEVDNVSTWAMRLPLYQVVTP